MCYNAVQMLRRNLKHAKHDGKSREIIEKIEQELKEAERLGLTDLYVARAFEHPEMTIIREVKDGFEAKQMYWGFIPDWVKSREEAFSIWNRTPNARGETIFEKASFKHAAHHSRCIVPLNGYFEHHHKGSKTFPYLIKQKDDELLYIAGLTSIWKVPETGKLVESFALVTTPPTPFLAKIHNNPKREDSRMLLILDPSAIESWLRGNEDEIRSMIKPNYEVELSAYTTKPILGKNSPGNVPEILEAHYYPELDEQGALF